MTLKDLGIPDIETLRKMSDDEVRQHFSKFLAICKPQVVTETKTSKPKKKVSLTLGDTDEINKNTVGQLKDMAAKLGFGNLDLDAFTKLNKK